MDGFFQTLEKNAEFHSSHYRKPSNKDHKPFFDLPVVNQPAGNLATQRLLRSGVIQAKLAVSQPGDAYEQEADRVAEQVMCGPTPPSAVTDQASVQRQALEEEEVAQQGTAATTIMPLSQRAPEEEREIQTKALVQRMPSNPPGSFEPGADFEARLGASGGGSPLPARARAFMEPRFGADFSGVRLHTGSEAAQLNRAINAQAFTHGQDIYLGEGKNNLESSAGKQLLAHELTHTIQQCAADGGAALAAGDRAVNPHIGSVGVQRQPTAPSQQVPGLGPAKTSQVEQLIKAGDKQGAIDMVTFYAGRYIGENYNIDTDLLADGKMTYDAAVTSADASTAMPSWAYLSNPQKADPAKVRIGPSAFSSVSYLYSVIMHEYQHVLWNQKLSNQQIANQAHGHGGMDTSEVEAGAWELLHATESGLASLPDKIAQVWSNLNHEYWQLDPAAQVASRPLVIRALTKAQQFVKGSKEKLDPFNPGTFSP